MAKLAVRARESRPGGEAAFTLVELIIASALSMVVIGGTASLLVASLRSANAASSRTFSARQAETLLARLTREARQAQHIEVVSSKEKSSKYENTTPVNVTYSSTSTSVSFYLPKLGSSAKGTEVTWACSASTGTCTRASGGTTVLELTGVKSATFTPYSSKGTVLASGAGAAIAASPEYPSSIQLALTVTDVSQLDSERTHVVPGVTQPIVVQDGVSLRNYGS